MKNLAYYYYDTELLRQLWCKLNEEWAAKWAVDFGGESLVLDKLSSKDQFYRALQADIFAVVRQQKGERIAKANLVEKDTIELHLNQYRQQKKTENKALKGFLRDKSRSFYAYYLGYENYKIYTQLYDWQDLQTYHSLVPVPQPSEITLVRKALDKQVIVKIVEQGESKTLLWAAKKIGNSTLEFLKWLGLLLSLLFSGYQGWEWYLALPLFTPEELAGVQFKPIFSTNSQNKATLLYAYNVKSLNLRKEDTVTVKFGHNYTNDVNGTTKRSTHHQDTIEYQIYKPLIDSPRLFVRGKEVAKTILYVPSNKFVGWGWGQLGWYDRLATYQEICNKGIAFIPREKLEPSIKKSYYTQFKHIADFDFAADTCTFIFRVKNPVLYGINANDIGLYIACIRAI